MTFINPKLYEINTRVWLKKLDKKIADVPFNYFLELSQKGINIIWLMGIWKTCPGVIDKYCLTPDLTSSYDKALKDWRREDVIGSPYSIDEYEVSPEIGSLEDIIVLREKLNEIGIKLLLDFVPNHFSVESNTLMKNPEIFLPVDEELYGKDHFTFFKDKFNPGKYFAHGRDPLFPPWQDTVQVNFFNNDARDFLGSILLKMVDICDGVRCDMAMLPLNNVFFNTWVGVLNKTKFTKPKDEFWDAVIKTVKKKRNDFLFIAEAYWDLEWDLQQLGFDYTYDKRLTDRLAANHIQGVISHLKADIEFQNKSVRFIENHDETRAVTKFGKYRSLSAATVISTIPGMKFYYDGQFEGKKIKLPVQLGREPEEKISNTVTKYYNKLLSITKDDIFVKGRWEILEPISAGNGNISYENFFSWKWSYNDSRAIVIINYSELTGQCRIKLDIKSKQEFIVLYDQLNGKVFDRSITEINNVGIFIELKGFASHIFTFQELL
jgi:glycosidase